MAVLAVQAGNKDTQMGFYKNDATAANNTSVNGIGIAGSSSPANIDNALRELAAQSLGQKIGNLLGGGGVSQALGGLGGLVSGVAAPVGINYQGEWTPAAGGNKVAESIGVGIGGENLRGVTNQYGATSMLGDGGSRTYGGPGGSSGK